MGRLNTAVKYSTMAVLQERNTTMSEGRTENPLAGLSGDFANRLQQRYSRQLLLPGFGYDGQEKLRAARALVVGAGGLGCAASQYLVAAGIGRLVLVDFDTVELSNLQRQVLFSEADIGHSKARSAVARLRELNPHTDLHGIDQRLDDEALREQIAAAAVVLDCSDNLATREQLNRLCWQTKIPLVSGAAIRMEGQLSVFPMTDADPCYQCFSHRFGEQELSCMEAGVLAPVVGIIGNMQALEAIKVIAGVGKPVAGNVLLFDGAHGEWHNFALHKWVDCPVCGDSARGASSGGAI